MAPNPPTNIINGMSIVPPRPDWNFEALDETVELVKETFHWNQEGDLTTMRVGRDGLEIEFVGSTMRYHSLYFQFFSLPTVSYGDQFIADTQRLGILTENEVEALEWVIGWCHEGGVLRGRRLLTRDPILSVDEWMDIWSMADLMGIPTLTTYISDTIYYKFTEELSDPLPTPSPVAINSFLDNKPYKVKESAQHLLRLLISRFAFIHGTLLDERPELYDAQFVRAVQLYREQKGLVRRRSNSAPAELESSEESKLDGNDDGNESGEKPQEGKLEEKSRFDHKDLAIRVGSGGREARIGAA